MFDHKEALLLPSLVGVLSADVTPASAATGFLTQTATVLF